MVKKLRPDYVYCFQKWVHIEDILMKLNMSFLIKDDKLLEKYNEIWIKKVFDSEPVCIEKYLKTKTKSD